MCLRNVLIFLLDECFEAAKHSPKCTVILLGHCLGWFILFFLTLCFGPRNWFPDRTKHVNLTAYSSLVLVKIANLDKISHKNQSCLSNSILIDVSCLCFDEKKKPVYLMNLNPVSIYSPWQLILSFSALTVPLIFTVMLYCMYLFKHPLRCPAIRQSINVRMLQNK